MRMKSYYLKKKKVIKIFFKEKLKKYSVESPDELSTEDKKKFFNEIDAEWEFKIEVFEIDELVNVIYKGKLLFESDLSEFKKFIFNINNKIKDM